MPTTTELKVIVGAPNAQGIMRGDVVNIKGTPGVVKDWRYLDVNMLLIMADNDGQRFTRKARLESEISVLRTTKTPDEELNDRLHVFNDEVAGRIMRSESELARATEAFADGVVTKRGKGSPRPFSLDEAAGIARLQESALLWRQVHDFSTAVRADAPGSLLVQAVIAVRRECLDYLTMRHYNALSRSTSTTTNLLEDLKRDAMVEFMNDTHWLDPDKLYNDCLARAERLAKEDH